MSWTIRGVSLRTAILAGQEPAWLLKHPRRQYIRQRVIATPPWPGLRTKLRKLYAFKMEGQTWDHIVPLTHPYVCGLNVPWNLQRLPRKCNDAKSNRWNPFQVELFGPRVQQEMVL